MTVARATVFYRVLCGRRNESADVFVMTQQRRQSITYTSEIVYEKMCKKVCEKKVFNYNVKYVK